MNEQIRDDEIEIDLIEIFQILKGKILILIMSLVLGVVLVGGATKLFITPMYSATSTIYILTKTTSVTSLADIQMGSALTADFQSLATTRTVLEEVIEELDLNMTYEELLGTITITNPTDTHFLQTTVENADPKLAKEISNTMSNVTAEKVAEIMTTDKPTMVEKAVIAKNPSSPNVKKNGAIGGLLFLILTMAIILLRYFMDDTLKNEEDVEKYLGINTLAAIPIERGQERELKRRRKHTEGTGKKSA
ncbi:MAG: Wzz/FepE/Etk N-terminal domain-containing protein [Hespellia sp.]|nr:Wzz/FepE/Etk N-terminal domain-containing protein [Hespellia sp.]